LQRQKIVQLEQLSLEVTSDFFSILYGICECQPIKPDELDKGPGYESEWILAKDKNSGMRGHVRSEIEQTQ
jgi:hypothetical protein